MSGQSSVGNRSLYEAGDQRNVPQSVLNQQDRYNEGQKHSHKNLDSSMSISDCSPLMGCCCMNSADENAEDERSIANKLAAREKQPDSSHHHNYDVNPEAEISKKDSTKPAKIHGNEPSKGAKIDQELKEEDEQRLREKGIKK